MMRRGDGPALLAQLCADSFGEECVLWPGTHKKGYGYVYLNGSRTGTRVTRLVCTAVHGPCPPGKEVAHSCGITMCCNAKHLRWATHRENVADKQLHGTHQAREKHPRARFTEDEVLTIRRRYVAGETQVALAAEYGVKQGYISSIVLRKVWRP